MTWLRRRLAKQWLKRVVWISNARISRGDPDFDDMFYPSRDAANTLLEKWFK